jgi:hypothetical protein
MWDFLPNQVCQCQITKQPEPTKQIIEVLLPNQACPGSRLQGHQLSDSGARQKKFKNQAWLGIKLKLKKIEMYETCL